MELGNSSARLVNSAAPSAPEVPTSDSYGLKSAVLSPSETLAQSVAVIAPTGAPVMTIPLVFALAGPGSALAYLLATVIILLVALNVNQFARNSASPGSLYTYIAGHTHRSVGVVSGWALFIAYVGTAASVSAGLVNYANVALKDWLRFEASPVLLTLLAAALACSFAYRDVQISARLMLWIEAASVLLIGAVAVGIISQNGWHPDVPQFTLQGVSAEKLRLGLVLAIFSSVGFESAASLGSEARNPLSSIPLAIKWSAVLAGMFFVLCAYAEVLGFHGEAVGLDKSPAPLHVLAHKAGLPSLVGTLTDLGAVTTFFACFLACITAAARILFLMARYGALHSLLGEAHESNQTPHRAVLWSSVAAFLPAAGLMWRNLDLFEIYGLLGALATFGFLTAYLLVSAAAPVYLRSQRRLTPAALATSLLAIAALGTALVANLYPAPPRPYSVLPYFYLALLSGGFAWSTFWTSRAPEVNPEIPGDLEVLRNETD
jgi:amino acid transporter